MADPFPNVDEFGRGSCTCAGTMTGCAVCSTADVLLRFGKTIPRLSDGTPDMRTLGARMGAKCRAADGCRHGQSLSGACTGGTNWCTYCAFLQLRYQGVPVAHRRLTWPQIETELKNNHPVIMPGIYGKFPIVSPSSYSSTTPARGRSDSGFTAAHMVVAWKVNSRLPSGAVRDFVVSDPDFGSPSRPVVPPHSIIGAGYLKNYWAALGWAVCLVTVAPPALAPKVIPWWGSDVDEPIQAAYKAGTVATKLRSLGITNYGKAINDADLIAGLRKAGINYGTSVQLVDVRALMKA